MSGSSGKTLIIRFSSVGDIVLSSLLVRVLRRHHPDARIDFLVKSGYADLVRSNPHLSGVIEFPSTGGLRELLALRRRLRKTKYDLVVDLHGSLRSRILCFGAGRVVRVRKRLFARFLLVHFKRDVYERFGGAPSVAERYLETLRAEGLRNDGEGLELFIPAAAKLTAAGKAGGLAAGEPVIGICPSARHETKIWPAERFAAVAADLGAEQHASVFLFGSAGESERCREIERRIAERRPGVRVVNLAGTVSLAETAALMDRCLLVLTNDSGLMHVAAARKRRVVAVFGSTVRQLGFFPYGTPNTVVEAGNLACRPCTAIGRPSCPLGHFRCMTDISEEHVLRASRALLED